MATLVSSNRINSDPADFRSLKNGLLSYGQNFIKLFLENVVFIVAFNNVGKIGNECLDVLGDDRDCSKMMRFR